MAEFHLAASGSGSWHCVCWLTQLTMTLEQNRAVVNVISNTCVSPMSNRVL